MDRAVAQRTRTAEAGMLAPSGPARSDGLAPRPLSAEPEEAATIAEKTPLGAPTIRTGLGGSAGPARCAGPKSFTSG